MAGLASQGLAAYLTDRQRKKVTKHTGKKGLNVDQYLDMKYGNKALNKGQSVAAYMVAKQTKKKAKKGYKHKKVSSSSSSSSFSSSSDSD